MPPAKVQTSMLAFMKTPKEASGKAKADAVDVDGSDAGNNKRKRDDASPERSSPKKAAAAAAADGVATKATKVEGLASHITDTEWRTVLKPVLEGANFKRIEKALDAEYNAGKEVFPPRHEIFTAFNHTPWSKVRVVLIGQDPYHDNGQAHGLCFSVKPGVKPPPSLVNMYKELATDIPGFSTPAHGCLTSWADQGVLMLNASLTVEAHQANSHAKFGWQEFTDDVIKLLCKEKKDLVFLLWGGFAQKKVKNCKIDEKKHAVIQTAHPSPLSATKWFGCKTFSKCNEALVKRGLPAIDWKLPATAA